MPAYLSFDSSCFYLGDIETFIDNIGRYVIKSYRVTTTGYKSARIFTTGIHIVLDGNKNVQVCFPDCIPAKNTFSKLATKALAKDVNLVQS